MAAKVRSRDKENLVTEAKKESIIKELSLLLGRLGYAVRRERLKQGHGWKVVSGSCRANQSRLIFVDRRLTHADQITFLLGKLSSSEMPLSQGCLDGISETTREMLTRHEIAAAPMAANS